MIHDVNLGYDENKYIYKSMLLQCDGTIYEIQSGHISLRPIVCEIKAMVRLWRRS